MKKNGKGKKCIATCADTLSQVTRVNFHWDICRRIIAIQTSARAHHPMAKSPRCYRARGKCVSTVKHRVHVCHSFSFISGDILLHQTRR